MQEGYNYYSMPIVPKIFEASYELCRCKQLCL